MKGCKKIVAVAPTGVTVTYEGAALEVRNDRTRTEHWTIHERVGPHNDVVGPLVAVVPNTWALTMVLNDVA